MRRITDRIALSPVVCAVASAALLGLASPSQSFAVVTFNFNFTDAPGIGFNDVSVGADRQAGLAKAGNYISSILGPAYNATINIDVLGGATDDNTLAYASSNFNGSYPGEGFADRGDVMTKILFGDAADPDAGTADGEVVFNFEDFDWEPLSDFQPGELDLISTAIHEMTHALGFSSDIAENGDSVWGDGPGTATAWGPFDQYVAYTDGTSIINGAGVLDGTKWNAASLGGTGAAGLRFNGPNAVAAAGGPVYLYSPTIWNDGSSGSHLDTDYYDGTGGTLENMMNHAASVAEGLDIRTYTAIELGILKDIGYTLIVTALPGDLNGDGYVGLDDLDIVLLDWNNGDTVPPALGPIVDPRADPTGDGFVGLDDLDLVLLNWNTGTPPGISGSNSVPEPATLGLLMLLSAATISRRR